MAMDLQHRRNKAASIHCGRSTSEAMHNSLEHLVYARLGGQASGPHALVWGDRETMAPVYDQLVGIKSLC